MTDKAEAIDRYRLHASNLRATAIDARDAPMRLVIVTLADDFEHMAEDMKRAGISGYC